MIGFFSPTPLLFRRADDVTLQSPPMARLLGVLQTLGAVRQRDGGLVLELAPLELTSLFGGALVGAAHCGVQGDALAFKTPPELAACGRLWLPDIADDDALAAAIAEAHGELRQRINDAFGTLRRLGFKARLQAPEPRARGFVVVDGAEVMVAVDTSGDLVVESVDGIPIGNDGRRSLVAPEEATAAEALALLRDVVKATHRPAPAMMSQEEFAELQAALSDDDDDDFSLDSDEAEPTAAGVPLPTKRPPPSSFEHSGTLQVPMPNLQQHTVERRIDDDDSDAGTTKAYSPQAAPPPQMTREASLLDEFDDDDAPPPPPVPSRVGIDVDFSSDEEEPEPTATRPVSTPQQTAHRRELDSEESDLLAALGDNSAAEMPPPGDGFDDDDDDNDFRSQSTSVNANAKPAPAPASMLPGRVPAAQRHISSVDTTAAYPATVTRQEQPQVTDDDFDDGKTRALVVDEALLARLKRGDAQEAATSAPVEPARSTIHVEDLDLDINAVPRADNDIASMLDDEPFVAPPSDFDDGRTIGLDARIDLGDDAPRKPSNAPARVAEPQVAFDDELVAHAAGVHAARLSSLMERERELLAELHAVQAELAALRASPPAPAPARSVPPPMPAEQFAAVGDSAEGAPEWDTNAMGASASLPSMASVDVHEIESRATGHSSILDAFDDDAPDGGLESDDDVVSLAALQGALKEMGVDLGDGNATQVAAAIPFPLPADVGGESDGDVFGSGLGSVLPRRIERTSTTPAASELSVEATRVRQARPAAIGLVVEDERARQRLRKHLIDRFADLFEADDATSAMQQRTFSDVDAIVFIRPSDTDRTRSGFSRLEALPRRPRVLVISTDERFDDSPAVDLRLPLAQKASEVARQVLEGLERLGVQASVL